MSDEGPACPECSLPMRFGGFVLATREHEARRTCRVLWRCTGRHVWWRWADRPDEPLGICPVPELFH